MVELLGYIGLVPILGAAAWFGRLEGRVNGHDKTHEEHKQAIADLKRDTQRQHDEIKEDIRYIRERIDQAVLPRSK